MRPKGKVVSQRNVSPIADARSLHRGPATVQVAVVIPCYKVKEHILGVIGGIGQEVGAVYAVDDACPQGSGRFIEREIRDPRVRVIYHETNQGVGGATVTGMRQAIDDGAEVIVKLDGDGQMDPCLLPVFIDIIRSGEADYAKGNRFYDPDGVASMPAVRLAGNAFLSFLAKLSTGYWQSFDPTNGYVAVHAEVARRLPLDRLHKGYFFETDLLFRLNTIRARVIDIPMTAIYGDETSHLRILRVLPTFIAGHLRNFVKRIFYNYFLRDFSVATLELVLGLALITFGVVFGMVHWGVDEQGASAGIVMLAGLPIILGAQLLLAFLSYDIQSSPVTSLHRRLPRPARSEGGHRLATTR